MKIALHGKMCCGKTTTSNFIINYYKNKGIILKKVAFADKVYELAYDLFNMKDKDRKLLQSIGTKMREIDDNVWIDYVLNNNKDNIIIDDARYINELNALKDNGFIIIKLDLDKDIQLKRLKQCYPDSYINHIQNINHESENNSDSLDDSFFDVVLKSDNELLNNILLFLEKDNSNNKLDKLNEIDYQLII
jgi:dephospho-CoA kinase